MSCIVSIIGAGCSAKIAKGFVVCCDGVPLGYWPSGPVLCADGTANAVGWRGNQSLYLAGANQNRGKVGKGSRYAMGAHISRRSP